MTWFGAVPTVLASLLVLIVPGLALGLALGLKRLWLWALAPAFSTTMLMSGAMLLPLLGISWGLAPALGFAVLFGAAVVLLYRFLIRARLQDPPSSPSSRMGLATWTGWMIGAAILAAYIVLGTGSPQNISQTFDNIFHLNAIAFIGENGTASPFGIGELVAPGTNEQSFYPLAWHALAQLAQQITGASIAVAANSFNLAIVISIWPLGLLILARQLVGNKPSTMVATGIFAAAFPAFPLNMMHYGVLYPYLLGIAFVPVTFSIVLQLLGASRESPISTRAGMIVLLTGVLPAITLAHPSAMMTVLAFSVPAVLALVFTGWTKTSQRGKMTRLVALSIFGVTGLGLVYVLRPGDMWGPRTSFPDAVFRSMSLSLEGYGLPLMTAALVFIGLVIALRKRDVVSLTSVGVWVVAVTLYIITAGAGKGIWRGITGVWYGDAPRLAAIVPIAAIPLALIGLDAILVWVTRKIPNGRGARLTVGMILSTLLVTTQFSAGFGELVTRMSASYTSTSDSALLSIDEFALLSRVPDVVAADEVIVGSPWTGTSLAFAFSGREVIMPHILMGLEGDRLTIMDHLKDAETDPAVCEAVDRLNARWVLDFGGREVHGATHEFSGLVKIESTDVVRLVDSEGEARLYEITACR